MELVKIKGSSYYINAPTNIGVYLFKNKNCLLVDTGINNSQARKIDEILVQNGLHPKFIVNTHSHIDHCGGNHYFQSTYPGCIVYSSEIEKVYIEDPELHDTILFSSSPLKDFDTGSKQLKVDFTLSEGTDKINDEKFEIICLSGHSTGQIGLITPEKVCFPGDSIFSKEIIGKYGLPYLRDIGKSLAALDRLLNTNADYFVISHSDHVMEKEELEQLVRLNQSNIEKYKEQMLELLEQPQTREDLLENLTILNDLVLDFKQYHRNFSAVSAFIKYFRDQGLIEYSVENGKLYYFKTSS